MAAPSEIKPERQDPRIAFVARFDVEPTSPSLNVVVGYLVQAMDGAFTTQRRLQNGMQPQDVLSDATVAVAHLYPDGPLKQGSSEYSSSFPLSIGYLATHEVKREKLSSIAMGIGK